MLSRRMTALLIAAVVVATLLVAASDVRAQVSGQGTQGVPPIPPSSRAGVPIASNKARQAPPPPHEGAHP
jgi:hypothetical protein